MSLAYGHPIYGPIAAAAAEVATPKGDVLWRVESVTYSTVVDADMEIYGSTPPRLELFALPVKRRTPKGATLHLLSGSRNRWVNLTDGVKQFASETPEEALEQFAHRKRAQIRILSAKLRRAETDLGLAQLSSGAALDPRNLIG